MKRKQIIPEVFIESAVAEGKSLARVNGKVVFVEGAVPGDVADIQIRRNKKAYAEALTLRITKESELRTTPFCDHFGICGGCKWQNIGYEGQLKIKGNIVREAFQRIAKIELPELKSVLPSKNIQHYRNKLEFTFSNARWLTDREIQSGESFQHRNALGFHIPGRWDKILDIQKCWLQSDPSNDIRNYVRNYALENDLSFYDLRNHAGFLRNLIIRTNRQGNAMVILSVAEDRPEKLSQLLSGLDQQFEDISSVYYTVNQKKNDSINDLPVTHFSGDTFLEEKMDDLVFRIGPKSFFQTNSEQAELLYNTALLNSGIEKDDVVFDLYAGIGTLSLLASKMSKKVVGIEIIEEAIGDANQNSQLNGISNASFISGDVKEVLVSIPEQDRPDVVISDPPRAGMHKDVIASLLTIKPRTIVYISCNPATQARDIQLLDTTYKTRYIQPVDMFPHTYHIENIAILDLRHD